MPHHKGNYKVIWPLVNYARMITLQNRVNETYNGYMAASQATEGYSMAGP